MRRSVKWLSDPVWLSGADAGGCSPSYRRIHTYPSSAVRRGGGSSTTWDVCNSSLLLQIVKKSCVKSKSSCKWSHVKEELRFQGRDRWGSVQRSKQGLEHLPCDIKNIIGDLPVCVFNTFNWQLSVNLAIYWMCLIPGTSQQKDAKPGGWASELLEVLVAISVLFSK